MKQFYTQQQAEAILKLAKHKARLIPCEPRTLYGDNNKIIRKEKAPARNIVSKDTKNTKTADKWQPINNQDRDDFYTNYFSEDAIEKYIKLGYKIALVPNSINACVIDIDNPSKLEYVLNILGEPIAQIRSKQEGRVHLYYKNSVDLNTKNIVDKTDPNPATQDVGQLFSAHNYIHLHHPEDFKFDWLEKLESAKPVDTTLLTNQTKLNNKNKKEELSNYSNLFLIKDALEYIDPDENYETWIKVGMALHSSDSSEIMFETWNNWSKLGKKYEGKDQTFYKWESFNENKEKNVSLKTLFHIAKEHGWVYYELVLTQDFIADAFLKENLIKNNIFKYIFCEENNIFYLYNNSNGHWEESNNLYLEIRDYVNKVTTAEKPSIKRQFQTNHTFKEIVNILRERVKISMFDLDTNKDLIGIPSGAYDIQQNKILVPEPEEYVTKQILCDPFNKKNQNNKSYSPQIDDAIYYSDPEPRLFLKYLKDLTQNNTDTIKFLLTYAGYSLTGHTEEEKAIFLHGPRQCGKSTFTKILMKIAGDYCTTTKIDNFLENKFDNSHRQTLARLFDKRLVEASEPKPNSIWRSSELNNFISGEEIEANYMRQNSFTFTSQCKFIITANHAPRFNSLQDGLVRRLEIISCENQIPKEKQTLNIFEKILEQEQEKIVLKLFQYIQYWKKNGLQVPSNLDAAKSKYVEEQDILANWLEECCEINLEESSFNKFNTSFTDLYITYKNWANTNAERPVSKKAFGKLLEEKKIKAKKMRNPENRKQIIPFRLGIKLTKHGKNVLTGFDGV